MDRSTCGSEMGELRQVHGQLHSQISGVQHSHRWLAHSRTTRLFRPVGDVDTRRSVAESRVPSFYLFKLSLSMKPVHVRSPLPDRHAGRDRLPLEFYRLGDDLPATSHVSSEKPRRQSRRRMKSPHGEVISRKI